MKYKSMLRIKLRSILFMLLSLMLLIGLPITGTIAQQQAITERTVIFTLAKGEGDAQVGISDPTPEVEPLGPQALTVAEDGTIYVLDTLNQRIIGYNQESTATEVVDLPQSAFPKDIVVQGDEFYVMDVALDAVLQTDSSGEILEIYPVSSEMRHGVSGITVPQSGEVRWQVWGNQEYLLQSQNALDAAGLRSQVQQASEGLSTSTVDASAVRTKFIRVDDYKGALQIRDENDKLIQVLRLRVQHYLGSMSLLQIDNQGNYYVLVEEVLKDVPVFVVDTTIRRFSSEGELLDVASVPINEIYTLPHRFTAVSRAGEAYFLRVQEELAEVVQLPFVQNHRPNLEERWQAIEATLNAQEPRSESNTDALTLGQDNAQPPITRDQIIQNAQAYLSVNWTMSESNFGGGDTRQCNTEYWRLPPYLRNVAIRDTMTGVPYKWGGYMSVQRFENGIAAGNKAGDACTCNDPARNYCIHSGSVGVDCSGYVSQVLNAGNYYTTIGIRDNPELFPILSSWNELKQGDILNYAKGHVMLFDKFESSGMLKVYESAAKGGFLVGHNSRNFSEVNSDNQLAIDGPTYVARRYKHIQEENQPPTEPVQTSPNDNYWQSSHTVRLRWNASTDDGLPNSQLVYGVYIKKADGSQETEHQNIQGTGVDVAVSAPGLYRWMVVAYDGEHSTTSAERTFIVGQAANAPFPDIPPGHAFSDEIACLANHHIVNGYSDGLYHSERLVTRGIAAIMVARWVAGYDYRIGNELPPADSWGTRAFWDMRGQDDEAVRAAEYLHRVGKQEPVVNGYMENGRRVFRPDQPITRAEAVWMMIRVVKNQKPWLYDRNFGEAFEDTTDHDILLARWVGITNGYSDNTFRPDHHVTRGQIAAFLSRALSFVQSDDPKECPEPSSHKRSQRAKRVAANIDQVGPSRNTLCFPAVENASISGLSITEGGTPVCYRFNDGTFRIIDDVPPDYWARAYIQNLYDAGITNGCSDSSYCPDNAIQRDHMVIFLLRAKHYHETGQSGLSYSPPQATSQIFADVSLSHPYVNWINEAYRLGITQVSPGGNFNPGDPVSRLHAALFLLRTLDGPNVLDTLPHPLGIFEDVAVRGLNDTDRRRAAAYEELYWRGLTFGCDQNEFKYCPDDMVQRSHAAAFISRAFIEPTTPTNRLGDICFSTTGSYDIPRVGYEKPGLPGVDEGDVVCYHEGADIFKMYFNATTNGVSNINIDGVTIPTDGRIWFSTSSSENIPDVGNVGDEDVVAYENGSYTLALNGQAIPELDGEDIDALHYLSSSRLYLSTNTQANLGSFSAQNEDIFRLTPSSRTFHEFFDGSETNAELGVDGVSVWSDSSSDSVIYMTFDSSFCVDSKIGTCGDDNDIIRFNGATGSNTSGSFTMDLCFDASQHDGLENQNLNAIHITNEFTCEPIEDKIPPLGNLEASHTNLSFNTNPGSNPSPQSITIETDDWWLLNWTARTDSDWLSLNQPSGSAPSTVEVSVNATSLSEGTHTAQIIIESADAENSTWTIDVTVTVGKQGPRSALYLPLIISPSNTSPSSKPDLVVSSLTVTSFTENSIAYEYEITNIGSAPANLDGPTEENHDNVSVQAFLSQDTVFNNAGDSPAGGTILGLSPLGELAPGESFTGSFSSSASVNPSDRPYLTLMVDWGEVVDESNEANNTNATLIQEATPSSTPTTSVTPTTTPTRTPTPTATGTPTRTPTRTATPTNTPIPTPEYTYEVSPTGYTCGDSNIIKAQFAPDDVNGDVEVRIKKCDDGNFIKDGNAYIVVDNIPNYTYDVSPTGYECGTSGPSPNIVEMKLAPDDTNHNIEVRIRKCQGGAFSQNGKIYLDVNGNEMWGPVHYSAGESRIEFDIEPFEKGVTGTNTYIARVYSDDQPTIPKHTGEITAWEEYAPYQFGPIPYSAGVNLVTFDIDPVASGFSGTHRYQVHVYPEGQNYPIMAGLITAWEEYNR